MKDYGKKFEKDFKDSMPQGTWHYRIKTRTTSYKGDSEIADSICFRKPNLFIFELKSTKEKRLPFNMLRPNQIYGIQQAVENYDVYGGILVQLREPYYHFYVPIEVLVEYINNGRKSIKLKDVEDDARIIVVPFTVKRVTCQLDINYLLDKISGGNI
jgi:penicillin-binding protein-related factor A (putative recombinase)